MGLGAEDRINLYRIPVVPHLHVQPTADQKTAQKPAVNRFRLLPLFLQQYIPSIAFILQSVL